MKEKVQIKLDIHEQDAPQMLLALDGHDEVEYWSLVSATEFDGDMLVTFDNSDLEVLIERKTPGDYAGTLMGKDGTRLDEQIQKLVDHDGPAYILIEGNQEDFRSLTGTNIAPQSLVGSVASTDVRYLDGVRFCSDADGLVDMAIRLARKHKENPSTSSLQASTVEKDASYVKRALGALDGVGPETADMLEERYRSLSSLLKADVEELQDNDGIGEKRAESIYRQLHEGQHD